MSINLKITEENLDEVTDLLADFVQKNGGYVLIGMQTTEGDNGGIRASTNVRSMSTAKVIFTVAQSLQLNTTQVVAALEMLRESKVYIGSDMLKEKP